jgi:hypothetical protein
MHYFPAHYRQGSNMKPLNTAELVGIIATLLLIAMALLKVMK